MHPQHDAWFDIPSQYDYKYEEIGGARVALPEKVLYNKSTFYNQFQQNTPDTSYACSVYGLTHCVNEWNCIEGDRYDILIPEENPVPRWITALARWAVINKGWSLQWALKMFKDLWLIAGYTRCITAEDEKNALARGQIVYTGSNRIDWDRTHQNNNIAVIGSSYGHIFAKVGYDDEKRLWICKDSSGLNKWDKGLFYIKYSDDIFFTRYAITDINSIDSIQALQSAKRQSLAKEKGWWNGQRSKEPATRYECATMAMRMNPSTLETEIWNGKNRDNKVTRFEMKTMFENSTKSKFTYEVYSQANKNAPITRWEIAEHSVRIGIEK
jgi:hypothetical protein